MHRKHTTLISSLLLAGFGAWASYRIHIIPIESSVLPILEALIDLSGRAPDQYRLLPYVLLGTLDQIIVSLLDSPLHLRIAVLCFDGLFLFLALKLLRTHFESLSGAAFPFLFVLVYPFLMFGGYRPIAAFILVMAILTTLAMRRVHASQSHGAWLFLGSLFLLSVTRADVALAFAIASLGLHNLGVVYRTIAVVLPVLVQLTLSQLVFPEAEYFSPLIMIQGNLSLGFLIDSPLTYGILAALSCFLPALYHWGRWTVRNHPFMFLALMLYALALFIIARPNEYRLFLPLLPLVVFLHELRRAEAAEQST